MTDYGFCLEKDGVTEEWLNYKAKTARKYKPIFYRSAENDELDMSELPQKVRENLAVALDKEVLIASLGAKLKVEKCKLVRDWLVTNEFADLGDAIQNLFLSRMLPRGFDKDKSIQEKVVNYFKTFDESIAGVNIEEAQAEEEPKATKYRVNALHKKIDSDEEVEIPLKMESVGTLKMFALYPEL